MDLGGSGWIRLDLGADVCGFLSWIWSVMEGFRRIINGFGRIWLDMGGFGRIRVHLVGFGCIWLELVAFCWI